ncbi:MAG: virion core protein (lumpy skin disease virus) [Chlorobiales bacterium]|jgi:membrane protease subunit (stomatin/prohibitin family)|nr:virion core protein (lumpy skin disease virus) [Chlorobiales bacterium]
MGIFDAFRNEFIEVIEWVDDSRDTVIWKFPDAERDIKYGAQLTVRESQAALFLNEGQLADIFLPGRYELVTQNVPILTKLKGWKYGFESPFKADVYFFNMRQFAGLKWGTSNPIIMRDPEFKQVRIRAFGIYSVRVAVPELFFKEFAGTTSVLKIADLEDLIRSKLVSKFSDALGEANISVLDLARNYNEIGERLRPTIQPDFELLGLKLENFYIENISLPPEVEQFLDKTTQMNMAGNIGQFSQFQMAQSIPDLAKNQGAGLAAMGAGFSLGNQMAQNMAAGQNQPQGQSQAEGQSKQEIMSLLKQLAELKEAGVLTEEEFSKKKAELLAKL